jgi:hypothetical protein
MDELSDEVHVYLDAFVVMMVKWIFGKLEDTLIFAPEGGQMLLLESEL